MSALRKFQKAFRSLRDPLTRRALRHRVAASYEHAGLLASLGPLDVIVDVGANVGQFALLSRIVQPNAKIHSFEPMDAAARTYDAALEGEPVTLYRTALGATRGEAEIHVTARADSSSLLSPGLQADVFPGTHEVGHETVRISKLSDVLTSEDLKGTSLLKIDVQGYEGEVLRGCEDLLSCVTWIYSEMSFLELYSGQPLAHELIAWLAEHGFRIAGVETDAEMMHEGRTVQADFLFRNESVSS
jgi:FkbM family methyltransferase